MIEQVEELSTKLHAQLFCEAELATDHKVTLPHAKTAQSISREISLRIRRWRAECPFCIRRRLGNTSGGCNLSGSGRRVVNDLAARVLRSIKIEWYPLNDIWPGLKKVSVNDDGSCR